MTLDRAIHIAVDAHTGQVDKIGQPYILHPLRVMMSVEDEHERIVAVLHDVIEDSAWTLDRLHAESFHPDVIDALGLLTHKKGEPYAAYIARLAPHPYARAVKIADLRDNLRPDRLCALPNDQAARLVAKYLPALDTLTRGDGRCRGCTNRFR